MSETTPIHEIFPHQLIEGYESFRHGRLKQEQDRFSHLAAHGQKPPVLLIGCCDSRVAPESIFDAGPGEIFVVRNVAALVPPYSDDGSRQETSAAIEFAVIALKIAHIVVMGHAQCGGVRAFAQSKTDDFKPLSDADFITRWKTLIKPAADKLGPPEGDFDHYCEDLARASIVQGLANLRTYPWLKAREEAGEVTLHGAYFGVANGQLTVLDPAKGTFVPAAPPTA